MKLSVIDPETAVHPLRSTLTDSDWMRLDRIFADNSQEAATAAELEAYTDYLWDELAARLQTHPGTTVLQ